MATSSSDQASTTMLSSINALAIEFMSRIFPQEEEATGPGSQMQTKRPWEAWELDEEFFRALSRWTFDNPETTLDRVLDNLRDGLENSRDLFALIPESPFPARGLVTALAHLLKLGISVRRTQRDVYDFARDVVEWAGLVKNAFDSAEDGEFTHRAWRDLTHMRDLIEKFSLWAVERLNDGRWLRIKHGLMISKEIKEFNDRISKATQLFQGLSAINTARGLDSILRKLHNMVTSQQTIAKEIRSIRKTQKMQLNRILNEIELQKQIDERERFFARTLDLHAVVSSAYDSQGKRPCDKDTRIQVLEEIQKWRNDIKHGSPNFLWLTGNPGCGKSAVTASFARECKDEGVLWAQFFINRNNAETTNPRSYFPSIARQLADYSPEVAKAIHLTLINQRSLTDDISAEQAARLFTDSVRKASSLDPHRPVVIVIDGLDETDRDRLEETATIFSTLFSALESYGNVKVFISSRTENEIQKSFTLPLNTKYVKRVHLDTADPSSIRDVSLYIKRNLLDLVKKHDLNWEVWPGDARPQALGDRASGLFIWAVTAIKFIQGELESLGQECLDDVLNMLTAEVLHDIHALYMLILTFTYKGRHDEWEFETFRRVVGAIICLQEPLCLHDLATLLDLRKAPSSKPVDVIHFVRRFRTILVTGTDAVDGSTIPQVHKSVYEFLTSNSVDARFHVEPNHAHLELAMRCLAYFGTLTQDLREDLMPMPFRYACRFWSSHFLQAHISAATFCADCRSPSPMRILSSLAPPVDFSPSPHESVRAQYDARFARVEIPLGFGNAHIWDNISGLSINHTSPINSVVLSPDGTDVVTTSDDGTIRVWDSTRAELRRRLVKYPSGLYRIAIAPDGKSVVSTSSDQVVSLWDYLTGALIWRFLEGRGIEPLSVAFSNDGKWIVASWGDDALRLLDARNGEVIGKPWAGHKSQIASISFTSASSNVCSVDKDGHCFIWNAATGRKIDTWECGLTGGLIHHTVSPIADDVIAFYGHHGIEIQSRRHIIQKFSDNVTALSFSPDGSKIIFCTVNTISISEMGPDKEITCTIRLRYSNFFRIRAFSPTWNFVYLTTEECDHTLHLHTIQHDETCEVLGPLTGAATLAFPDPPMPNLSHLVEVGHGINRIVNNQYLNAIQWYNNLSEEYSQVKLCMVTDTVIICGYKSGSLGVWDL